MVQRLGDQQKLWQRSSKFSLTSACRGFYSWYGQIESVILNYGRGLGELQWRKLSGERDENGLVTPSWSILVPSPGKLWPGILRRGKRDAIHRTQVWRHLLEAELKSMGKSWYQLERDAQDRRLWREELLRSEGRTELCTLTCLLYEDLLNVM